MTDVEDKFGEAITLAASEKDETFVHEKYILGKPEDINSKLAVEPVLRTYMLSLVSSGFVKTKSELMAFFKKTFYGFQYGDDWGFELKIEEILNLLETYRFLTIKEENLRPTLIGKRISELYLDPLTAWIFIKNLKKVIIKTEFSILQLISNTAEMQPLLRTRKSDEELINDALTQHENVILQEIPKEWDWEYQNFINSIKTALLFNQWVNERSEEYLLEEFNIRPGEIRAKLLNADWLLYACAEIARILELNDARSIINKTRLRVKHGIKEELLSLIKLRNIGRYRARLLFNAGWKTSSDIKKGTPQKLAMILHSAKIAEKVWEQINGKAAHPDRELDRDFNEY